MLFHMAKDSFSLHIEPRLQGLEYDSFPMPPLPGQQVPKHSPFLREFPRLVCVRESALGSLRSDISSPQTVNAGN